MSSETPNEGGHKKPPIPTPAKKIPALNIEKRGDRLYGGDSLHKWFAISSILLFVITIFMVLVDYSREWKKYQREFVHLQVQRTQKDEQQFLQGLDRTKLGQLDQQLKQTQASEQQNEAQIDKLQKQINDLNAKQYGIDENYRFAKAEYDSIKYDYEDGVAHNASNAQKLGDKLATQRKKMDDYKAALDQTTLDLRGATDDLNKYIGKRADLQKAREQMTADYTRLNGRLNTLNPGAVIVSFRNAPVFDFMNPSERIQQIILSNLYNDQPFKAIPRVDRCTTCHLGIDNKAFADAPQPFKTHPNLDMYISSGSPHPMENFGCTSCHAGLDRATSFQNAAHMPRSEEQRVAWEKKYNWRVDPDIETPMLPMNNIEAGCYKCHSASTEVPKAAALNSGRDLIRIYGCFGCHKLPGYEGVRKIGPDLSTVSGKLTKDWVRKWLANPKEFKSQARMPQFWGNDNNSGKTNGVDWDKRNAAEMNAITEYLFANSKPKELPAGKTNGNAAAGKQIVETVGCFGCHAIGAIQEVANQSQIRRRHGYNLENEGSKVSQSWLYNWVKDPAQVWPETKMPSLRLSDEEAADVAAYLTSLKTPDWEQKPLPQVDPAALDDVALELLRTNSTDIEARAKLKDMTLDQKNLYAGQGLISRYGCFGCHNIPKFENAQPIGTELTEAGSKITERLDFGFVPIDESRNAWYEEKLKDPRIYDCDVVKKDGDKFDCDRVRVKRPEELLKMPNFHFSDKDAESITGVLVSLVKDPVPLEMKDRTAQAIIDGRQLISEKNCRGCHLIEGVGGDIRPTKKEQAQWPPNLNTEGFKTQPSWLHPFLKDPGSVKLRPWLEARMPTFHFTDEQAATIEKYFSALDKVEYPYVNTEIETTPDRLKIGAELFQKLSCQSCHPTSNVIPPGKTAADLAPNLQLAHQRLRPDWVLQWVADPQKIFPGTRMPAFFTPNDKGIPVSPFPDILGGDVKAQIQAIRDHLFVTVGGAKANFSSGSVAK
ncbi:MAG TPA: c-type cytochrome [Terriglobia bacterium]